MNIFIPSSDTGKVALPSFGKFSERVIVTAIRHPFRAVRSVFAVPPGGSVADIMQAIGLDPILPARVFLDDNFVGLAQRERVCPQSGQILTVRAVPANGQNSKDQDLIMVAIAAVAAVATYGASLAASAALTSISASATTAGATATTAGATAASAGAGGSILSVIGQDLLTAAQLGLKAAFAKGVELLLQNLLIPPPSTPVPKQETTPHSYTVSGTANAAAPFSPIPKLYGQRRIFPQYAASPYNELAGFDQYLRMLFLLGYGPLDISQIKIGDTAIEDYEDVEWELRSGNTITRDGYRQYHPSSDGCYRFAGHNSAELSAEVIPSEIGSSHPALNSSFATRIAFSSRVAQLVHTGSFSVPGFSHSDGSAT